MSNFWQGKRVLCTGGSGFLGQHVVRLLQEAGACVFVPRSLRYDLTHPLGVEQAFLTMPQPDVQAISTAAQKANSLALDQRGSYQ